MGSPLKLLVLSVFLCCASIAGAQNLVANPGFETGNFNSWMVTAGSGSTASVSTSLPNDGAFIAQFTMMSAGALSHVSQSLLTIPGALYTFSFYVNISASTQSSFAASFNGVSVYSTANVGQNGVFTFANLLATGTSTTIDFTGSSQFGRAAFDTIAVTAQQSSAVPESGSSAVLLGCICAGLLGLRRRAETKCR